MLVNSQVVAAFQKRNAVFARARVCKRPAAQAADEGALGMIALSTRRRRARNGRRMRPSLERQLYRGPLVRAAASVAKDGNRPPDRWSFRR